MNDAAFYRKFLTEYVAHGTLPDTIQYGHDALVCYLRYVMEQADIRARVTKDRLASRVFCDTMEQFVCACLQKVDFMRRRLMHEYNELKEAERWTPVAIAHRGVELLKTLADKYARLGFDADFYLRETDQLKAISKDMWNALLADWRNCLELSLKECLTQYIEQNGGNQLQLYYHNVEAATRYITAHGTSLDTFFQSWALMGGRWNDVVYERLAQKVKLQERYPVLKEVADKMGRKADPSGIHAIGVKEYGTSNVPHASKSDIAGVSMGRSFESLLPHEWAHFVDADLEDVFLRKFTTNSLQTFSYKSQSISSARTLNRKTASLCGPMVVCVDTSGSMAGDAWQIALSLTMRLSEMCMAAQRECMLVAFSVSATPIDLMKDRAGLLNFFNRRAEGGTDVRTTLKLLPQFFNHDARYFGGDVLWISDFRIPLPEQRDYFGIIETLQQSGTRFYGLQLGLAENRWTPYFDEMFQITEVHMLPC